MTQTFAVWNIRGAHLETKLTEVKNIISKYNLSLIALLETKLNLDLSLKAVQYINPLWKSCHNLLEAPYGRILIIYNPNIFILTPILSRKQFIHSHLTHKPTSKSLYLTIVYAENYARSMLSLHNYLPNLAQNSHPWIVSGDFNRLLSINDRIGGNAVSLNDISPLNSSINAVVLIHVPFAGAKFTWDNRSRSGRRIYSKIDHTFCNLTSFSSWPNLSTFLPPPLLSDHSPQIIQMESGCLLRKSSFKFFNIWTSEPDFFSIVNKAWCINYFGSPMFVLQQKLKNAKRALGRWARCRFGTGDLLSSTIAITLADARTQAMQTPNNVELANAEYKLQDQYHRALEAENDARKQKLRFKWTNSGDRNTKFFHDSLKVKHSKSYIHCIIDQTGKICSTPLDVDNAFLDYFSNLLGNDVDFHPDLSIINDLKLPCLIPEHVAFLSTQVTENEIKQSILK